jgi:hypothetical protein
MANRVETASDLDIGADPIISVLTRSGRYCRISARFVNEVVHNTLSDDKKNPFYWAPINAKNEPLNPMPSVYEVQSAARGVLDSLKKRYNVTVKKSGLNFLIYRTSSIAPLPPALLRYFEEQGIDNAQDRKAAWVRMTYDEFIDITKRYTTRLKASQMYPWDKIEPGKTIIIKGFTQQDVKRDFDRWHRKTGQAVLMKILSTSDGAVQVTRIL